MTRQNLNAQNERLKHRYFRFLRQADGKSEATIDAAAEALDHFQEYTGYRDFRAFHSEQAIGFRATLAKRTNARSGKPLSVATQNSTLAQLRRFFLWLSEQPGYRSRLTRTDAKYFRLDEKETRIATARREREAPTVEQVVHVLSLMPTGSEVELRDRAVVAGILLTGSRVAAAASLRLKHVDIERGCVHFDAREVKTKNSKSFTTFLCPIGDAPRRMFEDWVRHLRAKPGWSGDDPLFPATATTQNDANQFEAAGLRRSCWRNASPIREIFKRAFDRAGLPYAHPHLLRHTLTRFGEQICRTPEEFKAWSQNLGHDHVLTTFLSYGEVPLARQAEILRGLQSAPPDLPPDAQAIAKAVVRLMKQDGSSEIR